MLEPLDVVVGQVPATARCVDSGQSAVQGISKSRRSCAESSRGITVLMSTDHAAELVHKVNNLLAVVHTQVSVSRTVATAEAARDALEIIERCAKETGEAVRRYREVVDR